MSRQYVSMAAMALVALLVSGPSVALANGEGAQGETHLVIRSESTTAPELYTAMPQANGNGTGAKPLSSSGQGSLADAGHMLMYIGVGTGVTAVAVASAMGSAGAAGAAVTGITVAASAGMTSPSVLTDEENADE